MLEWLYKTLFFSHSPFHFFFFLKKEYEWMNEWSFTIIMIIIIDTMTIILIIYKFLYKFFFFHFWFFFLIHFTSIQFNSIFFWFIFSWIFFHFIHTFTIHLLFNLKHQAFKTLNFINTNTNTNFFSFYSWFDNEIIHTITNKHTHWQTHGIIIINDNLTCVIVWSSLI